MSSEEAQRAVVPLGRDGLPKPLRRLRVRPAGTLKEEHEQVLTLLTQNFCRLFAADLSTFVGSEVDITLAPVQQWSWDDLLNVLPEPYCAARLTMAPIAGTGLMILDVPMAIAIIEKLLGGAGLAQESSEPLTEVELTLLSELHQRAASDLAESLALLVETQPVVARQESRLELIRAAPARSVLIGLEFDITMHDAAGHFRDRHTGAGPTGQAGGLHGDDGGSRLPGRHRSARGLLLGDLRTFQRHRLWPRAVSLTSSPGTWWSSTTVPTNR